ncbi:hypothetical protein BCR43DRAFT_561670 [Syncephalastrum racemosum]|uniref:Centrosomin N-terminal motif 1 domain-containing protein n=1 Tax=Syncephalastrum racemosum TaxID=13706 RepID=A0A1X2HPZ7_SYNRA|nr:hypothetical protein BCR43DRAFT_561670 [Syncephalastrum racemosum]
MASPLSASVSLDGYHRRRRQEEAKVDNEDEHENGSIVSLASSSSVITRSCLTEPPRSSRRSIYRSSLGKPPGTPSQRRNQTILPPTPPPSTPSTSIHPPSSSSTASVSVSVSVSSSSDDTAAASSHHISQKTIKTAPMKELENALASLKKENFDLKMRLYHLEEAAGKHAKLEEQNQRLMVELRERELQLEALELYFEKQRGQDASTQTTLVIDTSPQSHSPATASYHTAFAASPEAFGLTSCYTRHSTPLHCTSPAGNKGNNQLHTETDVDHVVNAFQSVKIVSPALTRYRQRRSSLSSTSSDVSADDTSSESSGHHQGVRGWLSQILANDRHPHPP